MNDIIKFEAVNAYYGSAHILHDVSFRVTKGMSLAILGRNGVGKTTIVNTLLGIARVGAGHLEFEGRRPNQIYSYTPASSGISVVIQGRGILPNLSVHENLQLGTATRRKGPWSIEKVLELFPILRERSKSSGTALSGGQQQMLAIGRALVANPALLVLDEPSEGLAPVIVDEVAEILQHLLVEGTSILLVEQNLSLVKRVAEKFHVLSKGRIVDSGKTSEVTIEELNRHILI